MVIKGADFSANGVSIIDLIGTPIINLYNEDFDGTRIYNTRQNILLPDYGDFTFFLSVSSSGVVTSGQVTTESLFKAAAIKGAKVAQLGIVLQPTTKDHWDFISDDTIGSILTFEVTRESFIKIAIRRVNNTICFSTDGKTWNFSKLNFKIQDDFSDRDRPLALFGRSDGAEFAKGHLDNFIFYKENIEDVSALFSL